MSAFAQTGTVNVHMLNQSAMLTIERRVGANKLPRAKNMRAHMLKGKSIPCMRARRRVATPLHIA
eukprot:8843416-Alexandrium_andersonii.AAC.1